MLLTHLSSNTIIQPMHRKRRKGQADRRHADMFSRTRESSQDQRSCWVSQREAGFRGFAVTRLANDGPSRSPGLNSLGSHKTRWVLFPARAKKTVACGARQIPGRLETAGKPKHLESGCFGLTQTHCTVNSPAGKGLREHAVGLSY